MRAASRIGGRAVLAAIGLTLASVASASASFSPPSTISGPDASSPAVAIGADGSAVVAWTRFNGVTSRVQARTVSPTGGFGPVQTLSAVGDSAFTPQVAIDADGDAVVAWTRLAGTSIAEARRISAAGALGPVRRLSPTGEDASGPQVAVDSDGDAIILWFRANVGTLQVLGRAWPSSGGLSPLLRLSTPAANASQPRLGVSPDGDGYAVWVGGDGANSRAQGRTIDTAGNLGSIMNLSRAGANAGFPRVDVDDSGNAYAIWTRVVGADTRVQGRPISSAGTAGAIMTLSDAGENAILPAVSVGAGNGVAVWARSDGANLRIQGIGVSSLGGTGTVTTLSSTGQGATNPQVAVDAAGNSEVVWQRSDGSHQRVQARPFSPPAPPQPVQNLSRAGEDATVPAIAFDPPGDHALAVWVHPDGDGHQRIQVARGP